MIAGIVAMESTVAREVAKHDSQRIEAQSRELDPALIRRVARRRLGRNLTQAFAAQAAAEWKLRLLKHVSFRKRENERALRAYHAMRIDEFEDINARQAWANWRTIPRSLRHLSFVRSGDPVIALDLCCGTGQSTEALACYLPDGSWVVGLEFNPRFVEHARRRLYFHLSGSPARVAFREQSVLEPFHDQHGTRIADDSVDLINSSGAVGFHFDDAAIRTLANEVARVLRPGGWALIDAGLPGARRRRLVRAFERAGLEPMRSERSCFADPRAQVCFRKR